MTSWPKRINNVSVVLISLINQIKKPDLIELNLSLEEFPNKEKDLPNELNILLNTFKFIEINWVEKNTGVFKKLIPTIKKFYGLKYYLLSVDDDFIYRNDYILTMINKLKNKNTDCLSLSGGFMGSRMIYKSSCFDLDILENLTKEIINTRLDDYYYEYYLKKKNKKIFKEKKKVPNIMIPFNSIYPNSKNEKTGKYSIKLKKKAKSLLKKLNFK